MPARAAADVEYRPRGLSPAAIRLSSSAVPRNRSSASGATVPSLIRTVTAAPVAPPPRPEQAVVVDPHRVAVSRCVALRQAGDGGGEP